MQTLIKAKEFENFKFSRQIHLKRGNCRKLDCSKHRTNVLRYSLDLAYYTKVLT